MLEGLGEAEGEGEQSLSCALILCPKGPNSVRPSGTRSLQHTPKLERTFYASAIADDRSSPDKNLRDAGALLPPPPPHLAIGSRLKYTPLRQQLKVELHFHLMLFISALSLSHFFSFNSTKGKRKEKILTQSNSQDHLHLP